MSLESLASREARKEYLLMKKYFAVLVLVMAVSLSLSADIYVKQKSHSDAMAIMGQTQPARDTVTEMWIGDDQFASFGGEGSVIIDLKKNVMYIINDKNKSYVEATLPVDFAKLLPPEAAAMAGMMKMTATVNPTNDTKKIGQWNCTGYEMTLTMMMGITMKSKLWASTEVPFDVKSFMAKIMPNVFKGQMHLDDASVKEMLKINGFQIATDMSAEIMGAKMHTTSEVIEISKKTAPENVYSPPAGYAKKATLSMEDLQKR